MNRFVAIFIAVLLAVFSLTGCSDKKKGEEEAIKAVLYENLKALQEESVEKCMATIHPDSSGYVQMEALLPKVFEIYDLDHKLIEIKVVDVSRNEAKVQTEQEARRLSGPENYRDIRSQTLHTLKKYNGEWRLFLQEHKSTEYLD